jgi:hypothetical protein
MDKSISNFNNNINTNNSNTLELKVPIIEVGGYLSRTNRTIEEIRKVNPTTDGWSDNSNH